MSADVGGRNRARVVRRCAVLVSALGFAGTFGCASTQHPVPEAAPIQAATLYPMELGRAWSFDAVARDGTNALVVSRVAAVDGTLSEIETGEERQQYERRPDGIFRRSRDAYLLRDPIALGASWPSGAGQTATVTQLGLEIDTPTGHHARCVEVEEAGAPSGLTVRTVYCPDVGPARVEARMDVRGQELLERATLRGVAPGAPAP